MGHRHPRGAAARTAIFAALAALLLAGGCAAKGGPTDDPVDRARPVATDDVTTLPTDPSSVPTVTPSTDDTSDPQSAPDSGGDGGSGGGSGGSENRAAGSPIDVPTVPDQHTSMDGLRPFIESSFLKACGGTTLCVTLEYQDGACFVGYDPSGKADRLSTVTVLTESKKDCDTALNGGGPDGSASGSPIDVPTVPEQHTSMDGLRSFIESSFVDACGGTTLCVTLVYQDGACFVGYEPSGKAERGSKVTVLTESKQDCDAATNGSGVDGSTDGSTDPPAGTAPTPTSSGASNGTEQTNGTGSG